MRRTSSGGGERIAARARARCACSGPADSQPMASDESTPSMHFESTSIAGRTRVRQRTRVRRRTRAACASSVHCTRVLVCKAQSREKARRQGSRQDPVHKILCTRCTRFLCTPCLVKSHFENYNFCVHQNGSTRARGQLLIRRRAPRSFIRGCTPQTRPPISHVYVVVCACRKPHHQNSLQSLSLIHI